ncbi:MAG: tRNA (guanine(10)-N(2))-dimethyltransferase [Candidatus Micrarchaeota archaeon]|nr:tRNA (guanine(10)-N(2))-dimethyltransferase [Candidatus Micrarchaeota archaeon]
MEFNEIKEGKATLSVTDSVFYNPHMEFNRDISSLVVGAVSDFPLTVCDGMSASGIRGIRYAMENKNIEKITFVDGDANACKLIEKNIVMNNIRIDARVVNDDINHHLYRGGFKYNFVELDPFGSPVPFIRAALLNLRASKYGFLSVTATDTAVLCGAHPKACLINYGSKPMNGPICHETGIRILISNVVKTAAPLHLGAIPVFSLSKRHYMKVIFKVQKSAKLAYDAMLKLGFVSMCQRCGNIKTYDRPSIERSCELCSSTLDWAGDLWLGKLYDIELVDKMIGLNTVRGYTNKQKIDSLLKLIKSETEMPPFYYDLHAISDKHGIPSPKFEYVVNGLMANGFSVSRTNFNPTAIKTDAGLKDVLQAMGIKNTK